MVPDLNIKRDVPIVLNSVNYEDSIMTVLLLIEEQLYTHYHLQQKLTCSVQWQIVKLSKKYKMTYIQILINHQQQREKDYRFMNQANADADDDFGFTTQILSFSDSKNYNPSSDTDE